MQQGGVRIPELSTESDKQSSQPIPGRLQQTQPQRTSAVEPTTDRFRTAADHENPAAACQSQEHPIANAMNRNLQAFHQTHDEKHNNRPNFSRRHAVQRRD